MSPYPEEEYYLGKSSWSTTAADWDQRFEVGDVIADPSGSWTPGTAEAYINQQIATVNGNLAQETIGRQTGDRNLQTQLQSEMATRADQDANLNALINAGIREGGGVQFDIVPTQNSANGITSGGMYSTLRDSNIGFVDDEPTAGSNNLVKSMGVYGMSNGIFKVKAETCGYYAALSNGSIYLATSLLNGVLFPAFGGKKYHLGFVTGPGYNKAIAYSANPLDNISQASSKFISTVDVDANGDFTAPNGSAYVIIDVLTATFVADYAYYILKDSQDVLNLITEASKYNGLPWFSTNFLDPNDADVSVGIFDSTGQIDSTQTPFFVSGYIPFTREIQHLVLSYDGTIATYNCNNNYYDSNKNLIKTETQGSTGNIVTWFEGVSYVRFSVCRGHKEQVEAGTIPSSYHLYQKDMWHLTKYVSGVQNSIDRNSLSIEKINFAHKNLFNPNDPDIITTGYLQTDGTLLTTSYFGVSGYIPFTKDMVNLICSQNGSPSSSNASICYYDSNKQFLKGEMISLIGGIATWFEGVAFIRWSFITWDQDFMLNQVEVGTEVTEYVPYEDDYKLKTDIIQLRKNNSILGNDAFSVTAEELSNRLLITTAPKYLTKNDKLSLYTKISASFNSVWVGFGVSDGGALNRFLEITGTQIALLRGSSGVDWVNHGLTLSNFIKVIISQNDEGSCHVILQTLEGKFEHDFENWGYMSLGTPFVNPINCTITDVSLSYTNPDLKKSVWIIGDSYTAFERWPQYMKTWGFWNFALFGLPGGNTDHMYVDLYKALKKFMPKYIVWLVGMNDNDSNKTRDYMRVLEALSYLCNSVGSELIVGITPTVATINHDDKRAFILDRGYRYIDVYKAVGANSSGQWYAGYLESDGVHPSPIGSQAIATQILTDFPEIMQY